MRSKAGHPLSRDRKEDESENPRARALSRGQIHYLLTNPVYIGRIRHKTRTYPGLHPALIDVPLWEAVQAQLQSAKARPRGRSLAATDTRALTGKLRDETGDVLTPTHTQRHGRRFAYCVSHRLISGGTDPTGWRLPAEALEQTIWHLLSAHLRTAATRQALLVTPEVTQAAQLAVRVQELAAGIDAEPNQFGTLMAAVELGQGRIRLHLAPEPIATALGVTIDALAPDLLAFTCPLSLRRRGVETRIVAGETVPRPDPVLLQTLAEARTWAKALRAGTSLADLSARAGRSVPFIRTRIPLAFLSPRLQAAILDGRQSPDLSLARLIRDGFPLDWADQDRRFGTP